MGDTFQVGKKADVGEYAIYEFPPAAQEADGSPNYNAQHVDAFIDMNDNKKFDPREDIAINFHYQNISENCPAQYIEPVIELTLSSPDDVPIPSSTPMLIGAGHPTAAGFLPDFYAYYQSRLSQDCTKIQKPASKK